MNIKIDETFEKDLRKLRNKPLESKIAAKQISDINNIKQLKGSNIHFRIRIGDYRAGLLYSSNTVILVRILHRKEIYRFFP